MRSADGDQRRRAFEALVTIYWMPAYKYLRLRWRASPEDAQDLTQQFFAQAMEKGLLDGYEAERARFRTYVRVCLDGFVCNERRAARRQKRGGGFDVVALDFAHAERELRRREPLVETDPDTYFHQEWVRRVFGLAVAAFERECAAAGKEGHFALFKRYDIDGRAADAPPSYATLAEESGVALTQVTNHLAWARRTFRRVVLATLRDATASDEEFRSAVRDLLGTGVE